MLTSAKSILKKKRSYRRGIWTTRQKDNCRTKTMALDNVIRAEKQLDGTKQDIQKLMDGYMGT